LPGVTAAHTTLPVIGVPIKSKALNGMDSLLSIVQMPSGVPVATVAIDGAKNAALLALQIIALSDKNIKQKLKRYKIRTEKESMAKNQRLNS
jgi:5-(carboxyamino)imidazole ribonucleotide mutase